MPEYFDITYIGKKTKSSRLEIDNCLKNHDLVEGENKTELFNGKLVIVSFYEDMDRDFDEFCISIPELTFNIVTFDTEIKQISDFVNSCFYYNKNLHLAVCSYEINACLMKDVKSINDINNDDFLKRFPIVYKKVEPLDDPILLINFKAQDIF